MARISATFGLFYVLLHNFEMRHYIMMLKCLKILKINVNLNVYSYFNILRFCIFKKLFKFVKYGSPEIFKMGGGG
jgi:hypothetical protein